MPLATSGYVWIGGLGILYLALLITAGVLTFRNRHMWLFFLGIFIPLLWLFGAIIPPKRRY